METNRNVLMAVCNYFNPDNRVFRAADAIQGMGYPVELLAYYKKGLPENETLGSGFKVTRVKTKAFLRIFPLFDNWQKNLDFKRKARQIAERLKPCVVHCHDFNTLFLGIYCKRKFRSRVIYDCHEYFQDLNYLHRYPLFIRRNIARFERNAIKRYVDEMIVVSPGIAQLYQKFKNNKIHLIRNIPDFSHIDNNAQLPGSVESFLEEQKNKGRKLLLYLGTNTQRGRGMNFAFDLLKELPDEFAMVSFGAGSQVELDSLMKKAMKSGVSDRFQPFLFLSTDQLFKAAKYCYLGLSLIEPVFISYSHSLPNKLFEYLSMGLPVVSSEIPDQSELITNNNVGLVIPFNVTLAKEILLRSAGRVFNPEIKHLFSWESEKMKYFKIYSIVK